ncbi:MAG: VIT1/CCC1 transporter family protein [Candidatus Binatia bacterium]
MAIAPRTHQEAWHTPKGRAIREVIFGMNDGLVTTIGFLAGVTISISEMRFVLLAGIAEIVAGALSMTIGAYLSTKSQREFFQYEVELERWEIERTPEKEAQELREIYQEMGFSGTELDILVKRVAADKDLMLRIMKREELGLMDEHLDDPTKVAFTMGISFLGGSLPPLLPYFFISNPSTAIWVAIFVSVLFLFVAGVAKTRLTKVNPWKSGLEMTFLGVLASAVGFGIGWLIEKII